MRYQRSVIRPDRVRRVPSHFSWLDQRLVREGRLRGLSHCGHSLYLFLATVADQQGLSWYSDGRILVEVGMSASQLEGAREELITADLVACQPPMYQVLELAAQTAEPVRRAGPVAAGPAERPATRAEVHSLIQATFGAMDR
jgi:hypothetical protein